MLSYILRNIPPDLWARVKTRAAVDEMPVKAILFKLLEMYADFRVNISAERNEP